MNKLMQNDTDNGSGGEGNPPFVNVNETSNEVNFEENGDAKDIQKEFGESKEILTAGKEPEPAFSSNGMKLKEQHPLHNPAVLTTLFRIAPAKQLATFRLVSRAWEELSLPSWRSSSTLQFLYSEGLVTLSPSSKDDSDEHSPNATRLKEFLNFWDQHCRVKPYHRFHLKNWNIAKIEDANRPARIKPQVDRFWNCLGVHVTALTLTDCQFAMPDQLRKIIFQSCPNLVTLFLHNCVSSARGRLTWDAFLEPTEYTEPSCGEHLRLRSLSVSFVNYNQSDGWKWQLPISYFELLSHFPALTSLHVLYRYDKANDFRSWLQAVKFIRSHDPRKLALKQFEIEPIWFSNDTMDYFNLLRELNISLKSARIDLIDLGVAGKTMSEELILSNGKTLNKIIAGKRFEWCVNPDIALFYEFPYGMTSLEHLKSLDMTDRFCRNMEFLKYTPNLEILKIYGNGISPSCNYKDLNRSHIVFNTSELKLKDVRLVKLKSLTLNCKVSSDDLKLLTKWLPNVENLNMFLNNAHFAVICKQWRNLAHLHVIDCGLTDAGFTGMSLLELANGEMVNVVSIPARITRLKELRCLKVSQGRFASKLTDASANGFLELHQLETLYFGSENEFSDATKKLLCSKIGDCRLLADPLGKHLFSCPMDFGI